MKSILFVDDEKDLHPVMHAHFPKEKFRLICAADGLEGIQKCRNEIFDLIILDFKMPKMDGMKFYTELRDQKDLKKSQKTPVIFLSGYVDELKSKSKSWERCEFLNKPFEKEELLNSLQKLSFDKTHDALSSENINLKAGDYLLKENEISKSLFILKSGRLDTFRTNEFGKKVFLGNVSPGEVVGEMAIMNQETNFITAIATERCELLVISKEKVKSLLEVQPPILRHLFEAMGVRLKNSLKRTL